MSERAESHWHQVKSARGLARLTAFYAFMGDLVRCTDDRLLSNVCMQGVDDDETERINARPQGELAAA